MDILKAESKKRNSMIEIWRLVFTFVVFLRHASWLPWCSEAEEPLKSGAVIAVEFFLLLTGFFMAASLIRSEDKPCSELGKETAYFVISKIKGIFPIYIYALFMDTVIKRVLTYPNDSSAMTYAYYIWDVLLLRAAGLKGYSGDAALGASWYLHAMFLAIALLYPLARRCFDEFRYIIAPHGSVC